MAKVITFSRTFPAYHPKKGQHTYFVEQILNSLGVDYNNKRYLQELFDFNQKNIDLGKLSIEDIKSFWLSLQKTEKEKGHTIRSGNRIKQHDEISYRVWSGKPYNSPQIIFFEFRVIKTWSFEMDLCGVYSINGKYFYNDNKLAKNDGLSSEELFSWFMPNFDKPSSFSGQIICWNPEIKY